MRTRIYPSIIPVIYLVISFALFGCATSSQVSVEDLESTTGDQAIGLYTIGVDDVINVNVWRNPELTVTVPVRPDGMVSVPLIGDVRAAGLSPEVVAKNIQKDLANFVRQPNVTVIVTELKSHEYLTRVRITGAVNNQISINFRQGMTVLDAVLAAGGVNDFASPDNTKLYRKIHGKMKVIDIYLEEILFKGKLDTNVVLRPGDVITVPERLF